MLEDMTRLDGWSSIGHTLLALMCLVWIISGWYIVLERGYYSSPRGAKVATYVDGMGATFMAFVLFSLAAICTAMILKRVNAPRAASIVTTAVILGSPMAYLVTR